MSKKIAVLISGCGVQDGAEIHETILTLLRLDENSVAYQVIAPNKPQTQVVNHLTGNPVEDSQPGGANSRNMLEEAARIARGAALDLAEANPDDYTAVILPGGFGVANNLSNFASAGADCSVDAEVQKFVQAFHKAAKPIGLMCIAPAITAQLIGANILCTVGNDPSVVGAMTSMGTLHKTSNVDEIVVDNNNKVVSTPAYMLAQSINEAKTGIFKLVDKVIELA